MWSRDSGPSTRGAHLKATAQKRLETRRDNRAELISNGWPEHTHNQRHFWLKPYGRVYTVFVRGEGFWMHLEGDSRAAFARGHCDALVALVGILEPDAEEIVA
jgi:hypothetical protein